MRIFVGIDMNSTLKREIVRLQDEIKVSAVKGRWKNEDDFHLTLKFLGDIHADQLEAVVATLEENQNQFKPFTLFLKDIDCFGKGDPSAVTGFTSVRVLWLGVDGDLNALNALYALIEQGLVNRGFAKDFRPYVPHITLGQDIKLKADYETVKMTLKPYISDIADDAITVDAITIFNSEVIEGKRVYTPIKTYKCAASTSSRG